MPSPVFPKQCNGCYAVYTAAQWPTLAYVGYGTGLEYRNCPCRSTLAVRLDRLGRSLTRDEMDEVWEYASIWDEEDSRDAAANAVDAAEFAVEVTRG